MVNVNGELLFEENVHLSLKNRAFLYGDAVFETIKVRNGKVIFLEDHYFRLMASMRMLRMKIPIFFTMEFMESEILKLIHVLKANPEYRVRFSVFRKDGGFYLPTSNEINFLVTANPLDHHIKQTYTIDVFKDFYVYSGFLSTIKTNNKMLHTLASIFADENDLDNCVLINEHKNVVEVTNGNIFIVQQNVIKTPPITDGCLKGIVRKKVIEIVSKHNDFELLETSFSPFEIQKADEVFVTNSIIGIQPVTQYKKKLFESKIGTKLMQNLKLLELTN